MAQRVGRGIALLFHDRGTRRGEWSAARPGRTLPPEKSRYPFYRRLGGPQARSGRAENLAPHRDSIPDRPSRSQSLYRLSYRAHKSDGTRIYMCVCVCIYIYIYTHTHTHTHIAVLQRMTLTHGTGSAH